MEPKRQGSPEANSSQEADDHQKEKLQDIDDNTGIGRSYGCNFCKRGFTNAQALGGHMNIHRKDKAKAKKKTTVPDGSNSVVQSKYYSNEDFLDSRFLPSLPKINYQVYLPISSNPNYLRQNNNMASALWRQEHFSSLELHENNKDENLRLRIGPPTHVDRDGDHDQSEVDLELRLGHNP